MCLQVKDRPLPPKPKMDMRAGQSIGLLVALLGVLICAGMAAFGFKGRVSVVGIDLGTTFSVVAVNEHGKIRVINDKWGDPLVPSIVSFAEKGRVLVGKEARQQLAVDPQNTIYESKRFIGRSSDDELIPVEAERHPYKVVEIAGATSGVGFELSASGHPSVVCPEEVGAHVLRYLLDMTANYLGHRQVTKAVVTVPAKFTPAQKRATGEAYKRAGLKVMRVLEEPTAAAIAYGLHQKPNVHHIMVYDFGGGTLDVSLLYVHEGFVTVAGVDGDEHLGGADFDFCLSNHLKGKYGDFTADMGKHQGKMRFDEAELADSSGTNSLAKGELGSCSSYTLLSIAEHLKKALSSTELATFKCNHTPSQVKEVSVSRAEFESSCADIFARALAPIDRVLEAYTMTADEVDEVVLVGGTTRIPAIRELLKKHLKKRDLNTHIDPDVTVAVGAAAIVD